MKTRLILLLTGFGIVLASCGNKKVAEPVPTEQNDQPQKMMIIAKVNVKPEKAKDFIEAARDIIEKSNTESGCTFYQLYQDPYDASKFVFVEEYKDQAAVDAHFATEYFKGFGGKIGDILLGAPEIKIITVAKEVIQ